jgi:hypothetical protein
MLLRTERNLVFACLALIAFAVFGPAVQQPADHHHFVDTRMWFGLANAANVLSNLPFAAFGLFGLLLATRSSAMGCVQRVAAALFFMGLLSTAVGSSIYHVRPNDGGLLLDRLGMLLAFVGLLAWATADRVSGRAAIAMALSVLVLGCLGLAAWADNGNTLAWLTLQLGGMLLLAWFATLRAKTPGHAVNLVAVLLLYALAKLLELNDALLMQLSGQAVSGHTVKHIVASLAAVPALVAMLRSSASVSSGHPAALTTSNSISSSKS